MKRPSGMFREVRRALADKVTPHPKCECGRQVPVKDWRIHRATCPAVQSQRKPTQYEPDPRD